MKAAIIYRIAAVVLILFAVGNRLDSGKWIRGGESRAS
jgi:hypothetical protein